MPLNGLKTNARTQNLSHMISSKNKNGKKMDKKAEKQRKI